jgi:hypothetical protein
MTPETFADIGLAALTAVMIGYAVVLDRRLKVLRAGQADLGKLVRDLTESTAKADRTLSAFRQVGDERGQRLGKLLGEARAVAKLVEREAMDPPTKARSSVEGALAQALRAAR